MNNIKKEIQQIKESDKINKDNKFICILKIYSDKIKI